MTEHDYRSYLHAKDKITQTRDYSHLMKWEPSWYPHLEFFNAIEEHTNEWEVYQDQGRFRLQEFKDFGKNKKEKIAENLFDCQCAKFIRAKLQCDMTFAQQFNLKNFPFDCQRISMILHYRATGGVNCIFMPELRKPGFGSIDPRYFSMSGFVVENARMEFGVADMSQSKIPSINFSFDVIRIWDRYIWNVYFLFFFQTMASLTLFSLYENDNLSYRLNLNCIILFSMIFLLYDINYTTDIFISQTQSITLMAKYIYTCMAFVGLMLVESSWKKLIWVDDDTIQYMDTVFFFVMAYIFVAFNNLFWFLGVRAYYEEYNSIVASRGNTIAQGFQTKHEKLKFILENRQLRRRWIDSDRMLVYGSVVDDD